MANVSSPQTTDRIPTYLERGDPAGRFADYHPTWVEEMASDVTLEGSILDGVVGFDQVLTIDTAREHIVFTQFTSTLADNLRTVQGL